MWRYSENSQKIKKLKDFRRLTQKNMTSSPVSAVLPGVGGNNTSTTSPMNSDSEKDCSVLSETNKAGQNVGIFSQFQQSPSKENDQPLQLPPQAIQVHDSDNNSEKGQDLTGTISSAAEAILTNSQWDILLLLKIKIDIYS